MKLVNRTVEGMLVALALAACQTYDVDPVKPNAVEVKDQQQQVVGRPPSPNIMLIVDRSGSMEDSASGQSNTCATTGTVPSRSDNCKWNDLVNVLLGPQGSADAGFLSELDAQFTDPSDPIRLGLTNFSGAPNNSNGSVAQACATGQVIVNVGPGNESAISAALLQTVPTGGTPTAATLGVVPSGFPGPDPTLMVQRDNYAILMTDGAPNCDSDFESGNGGPSASNCSGDQCTLGPCPAANWGDPSMCYCFQATPNGNEVIPEGCLDQSAAVQAVAALNSGSNPIKTFVIGFGQVTLAPDATATLNQMGMAGGAPLSMSGESFYQANSASDLQAALTAIIGLLTSKCVYTLSSPPDNPNLIQVLVAQGGNTNTLTPPNDDGGGGQYSYSASTLQVTITDNKVCTTIKESTANDPVEVTIQFAESPP